MKSKHAAFPGLPPGRSIEDYVSGRVKARDAVELELVNAAIRERSRSEAEAARASRLANAAAGGAHRAGMSRDAAEAGVERLARLGFGGV